MVNSECSGERYEFGRGDGARPVVAQFNGGTISSDAGMVLLGETEGKMGLVKRLGKCFHDGRNREMTKHGVEQMLAQRIFGLALGYEDLNDHDRLRHDPLLAAVAGKRELEQPLAGKSTLNRMELGTGKASRYKKIQYWRDSVDDLMVALFLEAHAAPPEEIVLDIDTTDLALHGKQEGRYFHGYYGHYCYLPLFIFCGDHVLCARLRPSNIGPAVGSKKEVERVVKGIRQGWPEVRIVLRGDSGFCANELMSWCEDNRVDFVFGLARNQRLEALVADALTQAKQRFETTGQAARVFAEFEHETLSGSWDRKRRVVAKAEHIDGKSNPRFVVTSLGAGQAEAKTLYEDVYCARGDMENRIKEQFVLFADRVSASTMRANQLRLYLSVMAYTLMNGLRRLALKATSLAAAQVGTIRLKLFKIGALVQVTARKVWVRMASSYPYQELFGQALQQLRQ